jgi:diacylglycerol kinase
MKSFLKSLTNALHGIWAGISDQRNLKVQVAIALLVIGAGFYLRIAYMEWCVVLLCIGLVVGLEMINSAMENLVDLVTLERKPLAGKIKDIAAGAVLFVSVISLVIGVIIFRKYLLE